jgi:hypothetical protein
MTAINFGVGTAIGRRTDISNSTPAFMGILQEIDISFDQTLKELMGQYKMPVDVAQAQLKVTGKAKFAKISANTMNDLFLGETVVSSSGEKMAIAETHSVPSSPGAYTVTVTNAATFENDLGVFYSATGIQLTRVGSGSEALGKYSVNTGTGVYTFDAADADAALLFYYDYTVTTLKQISLANQLMGTGPAFELNLQESYTNNAGTTNYIYLKLNACRSSKLTWPFKNMDYTIQEFDFTAFADQSNNWGAISTSE